MAQIQRLPYRTPNEQSIVFATWMTILANGQPQPLSNMIPNWDPAARLRASIDVAIDVNRIKQECGLESNVKLRVASFWHSEGTFLKGCSDHKDISPHANKMECNLAVDLEGKHLSKKIRLWVELILLDSPKKNKSPFTAKLAGSVLAKSIPYQVVIEGEGSRFPVEIIDFRHTRYPSDAGWFLHWDSNDLSQQILNDVRLYINSNHQRIKMAVTTESDEYFDIRETIKYDIARVLLLGALENEDFVADPDQYLAGSIGAAIRNMLNLYFPKLQTTEIRKRISQQEFFNMSLQEKLQLFHKG